MRLLVISDVSSYMRGGVPAETRQLLRLMQQRGHQVALASDAPLSGVETEHFAIDFAAMAGLGEQVVRILDRYAPDLVHVMAMGSRGLSQIVGPLGARRWLLTCHSVPPHERKLPWCHGFEAGHYGLRALRFAANSSAWRWLLLRGGIPRVVAHSDFVRDIVRRYGLPAERISMIPLGFQSEPLGERATAPARAGPALRLLTIGGIAHTKGQHDGIAAVARLVDRFPQLDYQIAGEIRDASYLRFLRERIERWGLARHVRITPDISEAERRAALDAADVYLQPSHEEGFCLAYIEAAAVVPRLAGADTGAIAAISADDDGARVVPVRSPLAIARAISDLAARALPPDHLSRRAERLADRFGWHRYADAHEALYQRLLS